ncbi:hypothetical protein [Georgenia alba]|uniref:Alternate signal-mediated exported protein, RER_14450 family n=1 Tax=Georgenia alba TaxID=2233858 RepID=A0ABW2Q940_9MICO
MRGALHYLTALGLVAATWAASELGPDSWQQQGPIAVEGDAGERLVGRNLDAAAVPEGTAVRTADTLQVDGIEVSELQADGVFVIVPVAAATVVGPGTLGHADLLVDGVRYSSLNNRLDYSSPWATPLAVGIHRYGEVVFDVPRHVVDGDGDVRIEIAAHTGLDTTLDSVLVFDMSLDGVRHEDRVQLSDPLERVVK